MYFIKCTHFRNLLSLIFVFPNIYKHWSLMVFER